MLTSLALARQETVSTETFEVYLQVLSGFSRELLESAIERLMLERDRYSKPFPTTTEIAEACREEAAKRKPVTSRYCGRCTHGRIRLSSGEVIVCECVCPHCEGRGVVIVQRNGQPYVPGSGVDSSAEYCQCRKTS